MHKLQKGFTLLELMVVIAIIGILASVAAVSFNSARSKATDAKIIANAEAAQKAISLHFIDTETYPADVTGVTAAKDNVPVPVANTLNPYLSKMGSGNWIKSTSKWTAVKEFANDQKKVDDTCVATTQLEITFTANGGSSYACI